MTTSTESKSNAEQAAADQLAKLTASRVELEQAKADFQDLIREVAANRGGLTVDAIAAAAGLSRQRIYQILAGD